MRRVILAPLSSPGGDTLAVDPVLAWAQDNRTGRPRYIFELSKHETGARCGCKCLCCQQPLLAVNAGKASWRRRPHFRHAAGTERSDCNLWAARHAALEVLQRESEVTLPLRARSGRAVGISGAEYTAWVEAPARTVHIGAAHFADAATAELTLDDGSRLLIDLTGSVTQDGEGDDAGPVALISIAVSDPRLAGMSPEELLLRTRLLVAGGQWCRHWQDESLDREAQAQAQQRALAAFDAPDGEDDPSLTPQQRRESLLHRAVKVILARARSLRVPGLSCVLDRALPSGALPSMQWHHPAQHLSIAGVELERRLGHTVPDVVVQVDSGDSFEPHGKVLVVEVTVSNTIGEDRLARIRSVNLPTLEIDLSHTGGCLTEEMLERLVIEDLSVKRWLHHPASVSKAQALAEEFDALVAAEEERRRQGSLMGSMPQLLTEQVAAQFLEAVQAHAVYQSQLDSDDGKSAEQRERLALLKIEALRWADELARRGFPEALDRELFGHKGTILPRMLSIRADRGVGYRYSNAHGVLNAIHNETGEPTRWHTLYLTAARAFAPMLDGHQVAWLDAWRRRVWESLRNDPDSPYLRDPRLDRLLTLLFPEVVDGLKRTSGSLAALDRQALPRPVREHYEVLLRAGGDEHLWMRGHELEKWLAGKSPEEADRWRQFIAARC